MEPVLVQTAPPAPPLQAPGIWVPLLHLLLDENKKMMGMEGYPSGLARPCGLRFQNGFVRGETATPP